MKLSLTVAILALWVSSSQAIGLDFGNSAPNPTICSSSNNGTGAMVACGDGVFINQGYGDVAGVVDVTYSQPAATSGNSLHWWANNYNDLFGVLWADGGDGPNSHARIELKPLDGNGITLTHFDFGAYLNTSRHTIIDIFAIGSTTALFHFEGNVGNLPANTHTAFNVNISSANGLWIDWQNSAFNVGIDNVVFNPTVVVGRVPEPATLALLGLGLAGLAFSRRKRAAN